MIDIFVDGLLNDQLKMKILRDQPETLQGEVAVATNEQNLRARVQMSQHSRASNKSHASMEADHSRGQRFKFKNRFNMVNSAVNTVGQTNQMLALWYVMSY